MTSFICLFLKKYEMMEAIKHYTAKVIAISNSFKMHLSR